MSDWRNVVPMIINKIKLQLFAQKQDNLEKVSLIMIVNFSNPLSKAARKLVHIEPGICI